MKQQVLVVHGGDSFPTYQEYLSFLVTEKIDFGRLFRKGWKSTLGEVLGDDYEIISPKMPNSMNARYGEWRIWFEKFFPYLHDEIILLGHSLGGVFLAKFLAENNFPKRIKATFLVAAPYDTDGSRPLHEFVPPQSLARFEEQGGEVFLYHSKDDPVVNFSEVSKYRERLPRARTSIFEDRGHFDQEWFPEIVEDIKRFRV